MITNKERQELRKLYETGKPAVKKNIIPEKKSTERVGKPIFEAYLDAKTEFSEPFTVTNLAGVEVLAIEVSGKTYYMTKDNGTKYIDSMRKVLDGLGGASPQEYEQDTGDDESIGEEI